MGKTDKEEIPFVETISLNEDKWVPEWVRSSQIHLSLTGGVLTQDIGLYPAFDFQSHNNNTPPHPQSSQSHTIL